jgi:hypothetical protein
VIMAKTSPKKKSAPPRHNDPFIGVGHEGSLSLGKRRAGGAWYSKLMDHEVDRSSKHGKVAMGASVPFKDTLVLLGGQPFQVGLLITLLQAHPIHNSSVNLKKRHLVIRCLARHGFI